MQSSFQLFDSYSFHSTAVFCSCRVREETCKAVGASRSVKLKRECLFPSSLLPEDNDTGPVVDVTMGS